MIFLSARELSSLNKQRRLNPGLPLRAAALALLAALAGADARAQASSPAGAIPKGGPWAPSPEALRASASDPILQAMQAELDRSRAELQLQSMQKPFFIEYRLDDVASYNVQAAFGAVTGEQAAHQRVVRVIVRIGDYKTDSVGERGDGTLQYGDGDNDPVALRYALWSATDTAYKAALRGYTEKQAALKSFQTPPEADDFSRQEPVVKLGPVVKLDLDKESWKRELAEDSGVFMTEPELASFANDIQYVSASLRALAVNRYLVNSEGTVVRHGYAAYNSASLAQTQAPDGMPLARSASSYGATPQQLDSPKVFRGKTIAILQSLRDLRNALVVAEEYHGPALFSGDAMADIFAGLFVPGIEARKPAMGTTARTLGPFASSYKARVLPDFLNVTDDPALQTLNGTALLGAYDIDDEGVPAQSVPLVQKGILTSYLLGRRPIKDFPASNGHGRAAIAQSAQPALGVLVVKATDPVPAKDLSAKLLAMAKDESRDYVYQVDTLGGWKNPRLIYKVTADGKRELVRGATLNELDQRSLRSDIVAAGDDPYIANSIVPAPATIIAPSMLFGDISIKRATQEQEKLPYYPPPSN